MIDADDLIHLIKQVARDEVGTPTLVTWGYVSAYDASTHSIRAILPTFRTPGPNGLQAIQTDWIQLGTPWSGNGFGDQMSPYAAGATQSNPAGGEQVQISIVSTVTGASVATAMLYNQSYQPPGGVQPGERIIQGQGGKSLKWGQSALIANGGSTPVAVEGSTVTHDHTLTAFLTAFAAACTAAGSAPPLTGIALGEIISTLIAVDVGQGAQDFHAPGPGGS